MTKSTIADLANEALCAFWEVVVRHNPAGQDWRLIALDHRQTHDCGRKRHQRVDLGQCSLIRCGRPTIGRRP